MILDARNEDVVLDGAANIAIVGAGPAGMTLARELANAGPVLLIESGGFEADAPVQGLYAGESAGLDYSLTETRARRFGGSSNLWAGYCAVPDVHDFAGRNWLPRSSWPVSEQEIRLYYAAAARLLTLEDADLDAGCVMARERIDFPFDEALIVPSLWRFAAAPLSWCDRRRDPFEKARDITVLLHGNVVDLRLDRDHTTVTELVVRTLSGREGRVRANVVVLACGGIETPRILLNADSQVQQGIGNANDLVGRCFMEHPHLTVDCVSLHDSDWVGASLERRTDRRGRQYMLSMGLSPAVQEAERILNARAHAFRSGSASDAAPRLGIMLEQAPNPDSRVMLADERDALGVRRTRLQWRLADLDWRTYECTAQLICGELERLGLCRRMSPTGRRRQTPGFCNHHIGTLRMAHQPEHGVVDSSCRVHGVSNLYIAGSSVFPTGSWANPTLLLVALALRLADHLRDRLHVTPQPAPATLDDRLECHG